MVPIDWGSMTLAIAALLGVVGSAVLIGVSLVANKPPKHEPKMLEPELRVFWPGRHAK
jgi:hypothetical protein